MPRRGYNNLTVKAKSLIIVSGLSALQRTGGEEVSSLFVRQL